MQNHNLNDYLQEDEIDLKELFKLLINSKKLIITLTLVITTLGAIYAFQKTPVYKSTALIEIGIYDQDQDEQILIEPASELIQEVNTNFIKKQKEIVKITRIDGRLFQIAHTFPDSVTSKNLLNEIIGYIENRHSLLQSNHTQKAKNQLTHLIEDSKTKIKNLNNLNKKENENEILEYTNAIKLINDELPVLDSRIELLSELIVVDQGNLLLLKSNPELLLQRLAAHSRTLDEKIYLYKQELIDFHERRRKLLLIKDSLEIQLKLLESNDLESETIFQLIQEQDRLEFELEFLMKQNPTSTQLIGEIVTNAINLKKQLIILASFIFGLVLSIVIAIINNSLNAFKEE
jgi:capsular polysaccharide biosynthesis protein